MMPLGHKQWCLGLDDISVTIQQREENWITRLLEYENVIVLIKEQANTNRDAISGDSVDEQIRSIEVSTWN